MRHKTECLLRSKTHNFVNMNTSAKTTPTHPSLTLPKYARNKSFQKDLNITSPLNVTHIPEIMSPNQPPQMHYPSLTSPVNEFHGNIPFARRTPAMAIVGGVIPENVIARHPEDVQVEMTLLSLPEAINTTQRSTTPLCIPNIGIPKSPYGTKDKTELNAVRTPKMVPPIFTDNGFKLPGTSTILAPDENPWLPPKVEGASDIKIAAITPIGTIAMVPTCDKRPPMTPRKLPPTPTRHLTLRVVDENTGEAKIDPILTAAIYLDCTKAEDRDYNHVAQRMRTITENTITLQKQYSNIFRPLLNITGRVSQGKFDEALAIYENNQVFYQDRLDDKTLDLQAIREGLTHLEHWFACIIEPKTYDDIESWKERELSKLTKGITAYCDPELYIYIQPLPPNLRSQIKQYQTGLL